MPKLQLSFMNGKLEGPVQKPAMQSGSYRLLPPELQEQADNYPYLMEYLQMLPDNGMGIPQYYPELSRNLMEMDPPNIIYPVKEKIGEPRTFIHIYPDPNDIRNYYIPIEPIVGLELEEFLAELEVKLLDSWAKLPAAASGEQREQVLTRLVNRICHTNKKGAGWFKGSSSNKVFRLTPRQLDGLKYLVLRDKTRMGILEPLLSDPYIEDISCSGIEEHSEEDTIDRQQIFIEHKIFRGLKSPIIFPTYEDLDEFVIRLADKVKAPVTARRPIVDSVLPDGSRINIVYGRSISKRGSNFTIRKFSETPLSILELIELGTLDYNMAAYLSLVVGEGMNLFVSGETASGKTTLLNAITTFIHPEAKVVSIEDTPELQVPLRNWIRETTKVTPIGESGAEVSMFELLKAALRQRPNIILVGEIRGEEGSIAFQAMQTGHAVMATFHAGSVEKLLQRLTGHPISVPKTYIDNLNVAVVLSQVKLPNGRMGRRILSISELVGYDPPSNSFSFIEVFYWDALKDQFVFAAHTTSYILEEKIALKLGIPPELKQRVYEQLRRRARLLETLHKQEGVNNFYALLQVLAKLRKEGDF